MNIVITGASRGIGAELAKQLAAEGHFVIAASRNLKALQQLKNDVEAMDPRNRLEIVPLDLEAPEGPVQFHDRVAHLMPHVDVLVNNAGALVNKPFETILPAELQQVYQVNVFGPFRLMQVLLPLMGGEQLSHIVTISSMGGVQGSAKFPGLAAYSSSKAALANLSELLAEEFKGKNIRVNCLALGAAQTEMLETAFPGYKAPLSAAEMANWIAWFAVNGHHYFNGKILPVALSTP